MPIPSIQIIQMKLFSLHLNEIQQIVKLFSCLTFVVYGRYMYVYQKTVNQIRII